MVGIDGCFLASPFKNLSEAARCSSLKEVAPDLSSVQPSMVATRIALISPVLSRRPLPHVTPGVRSRPEKYMQKCRGLQTQLQTRSHGPVVLASSCRSSLPKVFCRHCRQNTCLLPYTRTACTILHGCNLPRNHYLHISDSGILYFK